MQSSEIIFLYKQYHIKMQYLEIIYKLQYFLFQWEAWTVWMMNCRKSKCNPNKYCLQLVLEIKSDINGLSAWSDNLQLLGHNRQQMIIKMIVFSSICFCGGTTRKTCNGWVSCTTQMLHQKLSKTTFLCFLVSKFKPSCSKIIK